MQQHQIISRKEAKELDLKYYFTGIPCKNNHLCIRQVSNNTCCQCQRDANNKRRKTTEVKSSINAQLRDKYNSDESFRKKINDKNNKQRKLHSSQLKIKEYKSLRSSKDRANELRRNKYKIDNEYRASHLVRINLKRALSRNCLEVNIASQNYNSKQLIERIEFQFKGGMTWSNHGKWHIDHKKPVARFIRQGIVDSNIINALSNLQPLWAKDNQSKSDKF